MSGREEERDGARSGSAPGPGAERSSRGPTAGSSGLLASSRDLIAGSSAAGRSTRGDPAVGPRDAAPSSLSRLANGLLAAATALLLWQAVVWISGAPAFILPGPLRVAGELIASRALIAEHALTTIGEVLAGLVLGAALGAATALQLMASSLARRVMLPILVFTQAVPVFALAPILTLWLGYGVWPKIVMTLLIIYFPVASAFYDGLRRTDPGLLDLARVMGARPRETLLRLRLPAALPAFASGLRLAAVYAPIGAVIGEWVGGSEGLGYLMLLANGRAKTDLMFAALFVLAAFTVALHAAVGALAQRLADRAG